MMDCRHAAQLISRGMDEHLPWWQRVALRLHLAVCDACTNFSRQVRLLRRAVQRLI
jgi:predicted anti-sigma-YlaC factor YlaD